AFPACINPTNDICFTGLTVALFDSSEIVKGGTSRRARHRCAHLARILQRSRGGIAVLALSPHCSSGFCRHGTPHSPTESLELFIRRAHPGTPRHDRNVVVPSAPAEFGKTGSCIASTVHADHLARDVTRPFRTPPERWE